MLFLLDTGMRASELCKATVGDVDIHSRRCLVQQGKGRKTRAVFFSPPTAKALIKYNAQRDKCEEDAPLWASDDGDALTRSGLYRLIDRLGKAANITGVRCSPHTFRHTFSIEFLRGGGDAFTLQRLLGHESLAITQRYVALAQADMEAQHRQFSPVERLLDRRK